MAGDSTVRRRLLEGFLLIVTKRLREARAIERMSRRWLGVVLVITLLLVMTKGGALAAVMVESPAN
jgi:hypothetical protein